MSAYAVIKTGGQQYRVTEGQTLKVEKLNYDIGAEAEFDEILLVASGDKIKVGQPTVEKAKVVAEVVEHGRGKKIKILKFRRRKHSMKRMGHRQDYTLIKIKSIPAV